MGQVQLKTAKMRMAAQDKELYVTRPVTYSRIPTDELIEHASRATGISTAMIAASFHAIASQMEELLMNGHSITLGNIGTMRLSVSCKAAKTMDEVSAGNVKVRRILLTPSVALKSKLKMVNFTTDLVDADDASAEGDDDEVA